MVQTTNKSMVTLVVTRWDEVVTRFKRYEKAKIDDLTKSNVLIVKNMYS